MYNESKEKEKKSMKYKVAPDMKRKLERDFANLDNPNFAYATRPVKAEVHWTPEEDALVMEYVNKRKTVLETQQAIAEQCFKVRTIPALYSRANKLRNGSKNYIDVNDVKESYNENDMVCINRRYYNTSVINYIVSTYSTFRGDDTLFINYVNSVLGVNITAIDFTNIMNAYNLVKDPAYAPYIQQKIDFNPQEQYEQMPPVEQEQTELEKPVEQPKKKSLFKRIINAIGRELADI